MQKSELNLLVVEDDNSQREALEKAINKAGYKCVAVKRPEEAESFARIKPIHAAIIDCMLPGKSGLDLAVKLREHMRDDAPIIFISGIYKDKAYHQDAIKKVSALNFYSKPFDLHKLLEELEGSLSSLLDAPKMDLHALLASPMASQRERRKALDHVEDMVGYDLPFVLCILMEANASGHLNIVDERQNIFGVTLAKGSIQKVDSESTTMLTRKTLVKHGFISEEEISQVKEKRALYLLDTLVSQGLLSPHAPAIIKNEQIFIEINKLIGPDKISINFVTDRKLEVDEESIPFEELKQKLFLMVDKNIPLDYLKEFYSVWMGHPMSLGPAYENEKNIFSHPLMTNLKNFEAQFKGEKVIEELLANNNYSEESFYKALHVLAVRRVISFSETKRVFDIDAHVGRLKSLHRDLEGRDIFEIFQHLGLSGNPRPEAVSQMYKEFAKSHHPDVLPQSLSEEVKAMNHEVFSWVTDAHNILMDEKKKEKYLKEVKQREAEKQLQSEDSLHEAAGFIQNGKYEEAKTRIDEAISLYKSDRAMLHFVWVQLKMNSKENNREVAARWLNDIKKMPTDIRRSALYYFVSGLAKKQLNLAEEAANDFKKSLEVDPDFVSARREMVGVKSNTNKPLTVDEVLNADLGSVFSRLFKGKKGA